MPVRLTIQSESNPSRACRWSLPTTMSGTYLPVPTTRTPIRDRHFGLGARSLIGWTSARNGPARRPLAAVRRGLYERGWSLVIGHSSLAGSFGPRRDHG